MKQISINTASQPVGTLRMNWNVSKKNFPEEVEAIQEWFNKKIGLNSQIYFFNQPIWRDDLALLAVYEIWQLRIETDAKFVPERKEFRYIYAISISDQQFMEPKGHYDNRVLAEFNALTHCFQFVKYNREQSKQPVESNEEQG